MTVGPPPPPDSAGSAAGGSDPYAQLGIAADASFDAVQAARAARIEAVGDDPMARSRVEAAYDAILMNRLKERQQGKVSSAARSASQREQATPPPSRPALPALPSLPQLPAARLSERRLALPALSLASGRERWFPLASHGTLLLLLLALPAAPADLLLALATAATLLNLQRRSGRFLASVGWSFALLLVGLLLGAALQAVLPLPALSLLTVQLEAIPALLLLLLGALLIA
ncbi:MAG: CPP1-like family protein [Cyanobacteriota bacterium]|nr:CPP1-like family protein [Cyanobacteriota bacterium]